MLDKKINEICEKCFYACKQKSKIEITSCCKFRSVESYNFIENLDKSKIKQLEQIEDKEPT